MEQFGLLARTVFEGWGLSTTGDFGEIVFTLVDNDLMGKTERDSRNDFQDIYDFKSGLDDSFRFGADFGIKSDWSPGLNDDEP